MHENLSETRRPIAKTPQPQHNRPVIAVICLAIAVLVGVVVIVGYLYVERSARTQTPAAQPAPAATQNPPLTPSLGSSPASSYFKTSWGTSCQVTGKRVACQTCVPGHVITNAYTCTNPAPEVAINTAGIVDRNPQKIGSSSDMQQLSNGQTYHSKGWTIVASGGWVRFINDTTGHGMAVAPQNFESF